MTLATFQLGHLKSKFLECTLTVTMSKLTTVQECPPLVLGQRRKGLG